MVNKFKQLLDRWQRMSQIKRQSQGRGGKVSFKMRTEERRKIDEAESHKSQSLSDGSNYRGKEGLLP